MGPRTMMKTTALLAVVLIVVGAWVSHKRRVQNRTEADLVEKIETELTAPVADISSGEIPDRPADTELLAQVLRIAREIQGHLGPCVEMWPEHPDSVRIYVHADAAGRLETLLVEGAPPESASCFLNALEKGRYPRNADGVADLPLYFD
ncbi:MAG: hypothetical protein GY913_33620 [Proteobacteria bacterium]|nr:hypothetical protein [Pseudomonadota bacterium]MCP4921867.1 hypothetical protein [Pseudomonadota bacterium]